MKKITTVLALLFLISGCSNDSIFEGVSDDSGSKAIMEEAAISLDDQDYNTVISLLTVVYDTTNPDPQVSRLLASAYMGKAGIDTTGLISFSGDEEAIPFDLGANTLSLYLVPLPDDDDDAETCNAENGTVLVLFQGEKYEEYSGAEFIDGHCIEDIIDYLDEARYVFNILKRADQNTPDDDIQLGIASTVHFVLLTGTSVADALNTSLDLSPDNARYNPGAVPVPLNKEAYLLYRDNDVTAYDWTRVHESDFTLERDAGRTVNMFQQDLLDLFHAIEAFNLLTSEPNDVRNALEDFLNDALLMPTTGIDESSIISTMTTMGVFNYVNSLATE